MKPNLRLSSLGLDKINLAAGALLLWVAVGPWVWGYAASASAVASHVFFIFAFGPLTLLILALRPAAFVLLAAGVWLAVSPWVLRYATNHSAWLSDLVAGVLFSVVSGHAAGIASSPLRRRRTARGRSSPASRSARAAGSQS